MTRGTLSIHARKISIHSFSHIGHSLFRISILVQPFVPSETLLAPHSVRQISIGYLYTVSDGEQLSSFVAQASGSNRTLIIRDVPNSSNQSLSGILFTALEITSSRS